MPPPPPLPPPPPALPPPPQAKTPLVIAMRSASIPSMVRQLRRRAGMPKSSRQASVAPPAVYQGTTECLGCTSAELVAAVVVMVRVAVPAVVPVMVTGLVKPKLSVGGSTEPDGPVVIAAVNVTLPVKPLTGVTVIVDVLPVIEPGVTVMGVPLTLKPGLSSV